jgi:polysaccharide pyruvyl transferase WcaK-like protein
MDSKRKKIALLHHTGCGNLGDDAIIDAVVASIQRRWDNPDFTVFSMNPDDTVERHRIPSFPLRRYVWDSRRNGATQDNRARQYGLKNWLKTTRNPVVRILRASVGEAALLVTSYRTLKSLDVLIVSGGGQLTERGGPWSFPYALFTWSILAKLASVRFLFLNVGAGPLNHPLSRFFILKALRAAEYVSFRDKPSQDLATEIGYTGKSYVCPDNVYSLEVLPPAPPARDSHPPIVGIAPMPFPFSDLLKYPPNADAIQRELIDKIATFTSLVLKEGYSVRLFGSDLKADPTAIENLGKSLLDHHGIPISKYVPIDSVDELLSGMSEMDYVVTCRFHGVVFAHLLNKPVLAIAHHPKVKDLMNALGLSKYCVDMTKFDPNELFDKFGSLLAETKTVKSSMAATLTDFRRESSAQFDGLFPSTTGPSTLRTAEVEASVPSP